MECRAAFFVGRSPDPASMRIGDDGASDCQSQTCALRFGRKERIKDLICVFQAGKPTPLSVTEICNLPASFSTANLDDQVRRAFSLIASIPLSMRFMNTCCSCTRSAVTCRQFLC